MLISDTLFRLITQLADGHFHSGVELGKSLGVSRAAVSASLKQLHQLGIELHSVKGRGYRLAEPVELLSEPQIMQYLHGHHLQHKISLHIFPAVDSTNSSLKLAADAGAAAGTLYLAEYQSQGRGRRGRHWHSPFGSNLYLSLLWRFRNGMSRLGTLSLAVAVALMRTFDELGATGLAIKWPNDIVSEQGKVAGILVDVAGESAGPCYAVIGVGVNLAMPQSSATVIDQAWSQLRDCGVTVGRNELTAALVRNLYEVISLYDVSGFDALRTEWCSRDVLQGQFVTVSSVKGSYQGVAKGIDDGGMLLVERGGILERCAAGEVTLRRSGL